MLTGVHTRACTVYSVWEHSQFFYCCFSCCDRLSNNPVPFVGSGGKMAFSLSLFLFIYLPGSFLLLFHSFLTLSLISPLSPTILPSNTHTHADTHTITPSTSELSERGGGEAKSSAFWELVFYFFKGLSGSQVCMADRLDLIPGLIQSLSQLSPAQHVMAQLGCPCVYYKWLNIRKAQSQM